MEQLDWSDKQVNRDFMKGRSDYVNKRPPQKDGKKYPEAYMMGYRFYDGCKPGEYR